MSENAKKNVDFDPVTKKEIDDVFKTVETARAACRPGSKEWEDAHRLIDLLEQRIIKQRVEAAFEERRLQGEFFGGDERLETRLALKYAMCSLDKKVELENLYNQRHRDGHFIRPRAVSELMPFALMQIERIVRVALCAADAENVQLKARVAELEAKLPGKMIIPQGPCVVTGPAATTEDASKLTAHVEASKTPGED